MEEKQKVMEDKEILNRILSKLRYNPNSMAKEIGITSSALYHIKNGKNKISDDLCRKLTVKFPNLNYLFLKLGQEPVILNDIKIHESKNAFSDKDLPTFNDIPNVLKNIEILLIKILESLDK